MTLKKFSNSLFHVCPLLKHWGDDHEQTFQSFLAYKTRVPVCGAIMLNETWDKVRVWPRHRNRFSHFPARSVCLSRVGNQHQRGVSRREKSTSRNQGRSVLYERYDINHPPICTYPHHFSGFRRDRIRSRRADKPCRRRRNLHQGPVIIIIYCT